VPLIFAFLQPVLVNNGYYRPDLNALTLTDRKSLLI